MKTSVLSTVMVLFRPASASVDVRNGWDLVKYELAKLFLTRDVDVAATLTALRRLQFFRAFVTEWVANTFFYKGGHRYQWRGHFSYETARRLLTTGMGDEGGMGKKANLTNALARLPKEDREWVEANIELVNTLILGALMDYGLVAFQGEGADGFTLDLSYPGAANSPSWTRRPLPFTVSKDDGTVELSPELRSSVAFSTFYHMTKESFKGITSAPERINVSLAVEAVMAVFNGISAVATDNVADVVDRLYDMMGWAWHDALVGHKASSTYADVFTSIVNFWTSPAPTVATSEPSLMQIDHARPYVARALAALREHPFMREETVAEYREKYRRNRQTTAERDVPGVVFIGRNVPLPKPRPVMLGTQSTDLGLNEHYLVVDKGAPSPYELSVDPEFTMTALVESMAVLSGAPALISTVHGLELEILTACVAGRISFIKDEPQARMVMRSGPERDEIPRERGESDEDFEARVNAMKLDVTPHREHTLIYHFPVAKEAMLTLHKPLLMFEDKGDIASTRHGELVLMLAPDDCFGTRAYEVAQGIDIDLSPRSRLTMVADATWSPPSASIVTRQTMTLQTLVTKYSSAYSTPGNTVTEMVLEDVKVPVSLNIAYGMRTVLADVSMWAPIDVIASMEEQTRPVYFLYNLLYHNDPESATVETLNGSNGAYADMYYAYVDPDVRRVVRDRLARPLQVAKIRRPSTAAKEVIESVRVIFEARMAAEIDRVASSPLVNEVETSALQASSVARSELMTIEAANAAARMRASIAAALLRCSYTFNGAVRESSGESSNVRTLTRTTSPAWRPASSFVSLALTDAVYSNTQILINAGRPLMRRRSE